MKIGAFFKWFFGKSEKRTPRARFVFDSEPALQPMQKRTMTPKEANTRCLNLKSHGFTPKQIARYLNTNGFLTPRGYKWQENHAKYWSQTPAELTQKRKESRDYWNRRFSKMQTPQNSQNGYMRIN